MPPSDPKTERPRLRTLTERNTPKGHGATFYILVFVTAILVVNAVFGDRGVVALARANRQCSEVEMSVARQREENARLAEKMRKLTSDPATIEAIAREQLGLIRPGEKVFIIHDLPAVAPTPKK